MKIHEYQAKEILTKYGIPVPEGDVAARAEEAEKVAADLGSPVAVKAQVHVGGRGKAGGIKLAATPGETRKVARDILGMKIKGMPVRKVLVERSVKVGSEIYLGIVVDRAKRVPVLMASAEGGIEIEEVANRSPEKILKIWVSPTLGLKEHQVRRLTLFLGIPKEVSKAFSEIVFRLSWCFVEKDCSLVEINPLVITETDKLMALDAKINFDDNALFRHPELESLRDVDEEDPLESSARLLGLSYVRMSGNIGCIVNGAGLAMATMDSIKLFGGEPANFLDVGGGAKAEEVERALRIVTSDKNVKVVLLNIFGGIVRCDLVAEGLLAAMKNMGIKLPIVVRLVGTNEDAARGMLAETSLITCNSMAEAAQKAVEVAAT